MTTAKELKQKEKELKDRLENYNKDSKEYNNICKGLDEVRTDLMALGVY